MSNPLRERLEALRREADRWTWLATPENHAYGKGMQACVEAIEAVLSDPQRAPQTSADSLKDFLRDAIASDRLRMAADNIDRKRYEEAETIVVAILDELRELRAKEEK